MKNLGQIQSDAIRLGKIDISDTTAINNIITDANDACNIVASQKNWDELYKTNTISLSSGDGDIAYALSTDVDKVSQVRITSPSDYSKVIEYVNRKTFRIGTPNKTIPGPSTPSFWYWEMSTFSSDNVETKNISFDVRPDRAYTILYEYKSNQPTITGSTNYPFFDNNYHHIIVDYVLWKYAQRTPDSTLDPIYFRGEWESGLQELLDSYMQKTTDLSVIPGPD